MSFPDKDPTRWGSFASTAWQMFGTAVVAVAIFVMATLQTGPALDSFAAVLNAQWHETGHAVIAVLLGGTVHALQITADGGGHVIAQTSSETKQVFVSGAGMLVQALVGAVTLYAGLTRRYLHPVLVLWAAVSLVVCSFFTTDTAACVALACTGIATLALAYVPLHAGLKAPFVLLLALVTGLGLINGLGYAYAGDLGHPADPMPSDSLRIAQALALPLEVVGHMLVAAMALIYLVSAAAVAGFLGRNP